MAINKSGEFHILPDRHEAFEAMKKLARLACYQMQHDRPEHGAEVMLSKLMSEDIAGSGATDGQTEE